MERRPPMVDITIEASPGQLRGYLAAPNGDGPWPGIVVLHEAHPGGLNDDIRRQSDRLASQGYLTFALDQYSRGRDFRCLMRVFRELRKQRGQSFADIEVSRQWLAAQQNCTGRVGVIGFCQGGGFALVAAAHYDFAVASVNYGMVPSNATQVLEGACPIVASYGKRDRILPGVAAKLEQTLTTLGVPHDVKEYPNAGHSFLNHHEYGPPWSVFSRIVGITGYQESEAKDAWRRITTFFGEYLS
jgi:carboxymethylenebutenolidase